MQAASLDQVFSALADPTRRAILARLAGGEASVNDLVAPFSLSQPTISKHLKVLESAGLVTRGRDAQRRPVRLNAAPLEQAAGWIGDYRRFWEASFDRLENYVQTLTQEEKKAMSQDEEERSITVTREFDAPPSILFRAHSAPEHVRRWFGPKGWPLTLCEMDFRAGGKWRFAMTGPDGKQNAAFGGEYLDIVPNERIVYDNAFELPGAEKMVTTVTFDPLPGDRTLLVMRTVFANLAMHATHVGAGIESGINSGLDQLADVVADLRAAQG